MKPKTVSDLFARVWKVHYNTDRFKASGTALEAHRIYEHYIAPTFGSKQYSTVTALQIRAWHNGMAATPVMANRCLEVLSKLFSYAEQQEWQPQGTNPVRLVKTYRERKRKRFATPEELKKLSSILEREEAKNPKAVAFIYILMFSGARPRSIERATWQELQIVNHKGSSFGVLTFFGKSSAETGEDEQVIIPPQAMKLLPSRQKPKDKILGIKMPKDFWMRIRKEAGCEDLWARDLRRTFGVVGLSNGTSAGMIGQLLNHKSPATTNRYLGVFQDKRLEATKQIADQITRLLKGG